MVREVVTLTVGQCGVQIGNALWELFCMEHGIQHTGYPLDIDSMTTDLGYQTFFTEGAPNPHGVRYVPRTVVCDLEPTVIDEIRLGAYRDLFDPETLINGTEDAANNYARGHFTQGKTQVNLIMDRVRKIASACDNLEAFFIISGSGGGTGSGLTDILAEKLSLEFSKRTKVQTSIYPGGVYSTAMVEPYNCMLTVNSSIHNIDMSLQVDNEALYTICTSQLQVPRPTYNDTNRVVAQTLSMLTSALRFENYLNSDLSQIQTNLVPYPRIHFPVASYAPFHSKCQTQFERNTVREITLMTQERQHQLASIDMAAGKFMSAIMQYRGKCSPQQVNKAITVLKQNTGSDAGGMSFVDWCPTGFKVGLCCAPMATSPNSAMTPSDISVSCVANNTSVGIIWEKLARKFDLMFNKRAFVHWFVGEGMEEGEFLEAKEHIMSLRKDYEECGKPSEVEETDGGEEEDFGGGSPEASPSPAQGGSEGGKAASESVKGGSESAKGGSEAGEIGGEGSEVGGEDCEDGEGDENGEGGEGGESVEGGEGAEGGEGGEEVAENASEHSEKVQEEEEEEETGEDAELGENVSNLLKNHYKQPIYSNLNYNNSFPDIKFRVDPQTRHLMIQPF